jgi:DNA-binding transcriptional LysR family regulator
LDTELLRTFLEVRSTRHFGRAAQNLCITQSAVSARIRQLEAALGVTLFLRERHNIRLSAEGERLVPHAETVLLALARARRDVSLDDGSGQPVYLLVATGIWSAALQGCLQALREGQPDLYLRIDSREPEVITRMLLERTADLALLCEPPRYPELECLPVGEMTLRLFSSRRRDTVQRALTDHYVFLDWGPSFAHFHGRRFGEQSAARLQTNMPWLADGLLASRGGAAYLPDSERRRLAQRGLYPVPGAPVFSRQLTMVWHGSATQREQLETIAAGFSGARM